VSEDSLRVEVYQTDAEVYGAAAELAANHLRAAAGGAAAAVALPGGRDGRGLMVALASRGDVPWERIEWFWSEERCVPPTDPASNVRAARQSLIEPRAIAAARIHPAPVELGACEEVARAYGEVLARVLGPAVPPIFDLVLLAVGPDGQVAGLAPGCAALAASAAVAAVPASEVREEPRVARVTLTPAVLGAARRVIVTAVGDASAAAVAAALREPAPVERVPARLVRPSATVAWVIDRQAARELLREAQPAN
jgi:6-phosphogluconolactonase